MAIDVILALSVIGEMLLCSYCLRFCLFSVPRVGKVSFLGTFLLISVEASKTCCSSNIKKHRLTF